MEIRLTLKRDRGYTGSKEVRTDDHESYACGNYPVLADDFTGLLKCSLWKSFGIAAMSICLVIYAAAYWLGRRIVDIEV